jgi:signal transduction histidine kinase/uncharacterized membrane protein YhdT
LQPLQCGFFVFLVIKLLLLCMSFLFLNQIFILLINVFALSIGVFVYRNNSEKRINDILGMMVIFILFWIDFAYIARLISDDNGAFSLLFFKIAWIAMPLLFASLYFLTINLLEKNKNYKILSKAVIFTSFLSAFMVGYNSLVIKSTNLTGYNIMIDYGKGINFFLFFITFIMGATLYVFFKEYFKAPLLLKTKLQYLLLGITFFYSANFSFNIVIPMFFDVTRFCWIGDYSVIILLTFIAYAIIKKNLFDIKVVLTSVFVILIASLLFLDVIFSAEDLWQMAVKGVILLIFLVFGWQLVKSVIIEIKQRKKLEEAYEKLQQLDQAKTEFMAIVSHQLRTPLSITKGHLSMVDEGVYDERPRKRKKVLRDVFRANERLINLVNDVLSTSRIQSGKIKVVKEESDIVKIIDNVVKKVKRRTKEKQIKIFFHKPKNSISIKIDVLKTENLFFNLFDNAVKYTNQGRVDVSIKNKKDFIEIKIKDTGEGMTKEEINKLFKTFSRGEAGKRYWVQGSGLGLYIARQFSEMQGGKVWAESEGKGKGSQFYIKIPK